VLKNLFFAGILKVNDENDEIRIQDPNPDPLVRGMDPRIRIHPKMSWIRNTAFVDPDPDWIQIHWGPPGSVADPGCLSRIRMLSIPDPNFAGSCFFYSSRIPDPGVKKAPDSGSAILVSGHGTDSH
jgi:hypothetical protein